MATSDPLAFPSTAFCLRFDPSRQPRELVELAEAIYERACRSDLASPGFCLVDCGQDVDSGALRRLMVALKDRLASIHRAKRRRDLVYLSAARFDQQVTTKLHLDGGPAECFLMLGYEPSEVAAELVMADFSRCAFDLGMSPAEFLEKHNPMFKAGQRLLEPYLTRVSCFRPDHASIVVINNSLASDGFDSASWKGVLHSATTPQPDESRRRIINSTMIASVPLGFAEPLSPDELHEFLTTNAVRRQGYDKTHLVDDK